MHRERLSQWDVPRAAALRSSRRRLGHALLIVFGSCLAASECPALCIPLPSAELRDLDQQTSIEPERALAEAETRLAAAPSDSLLTAELHSIGADAAGEASRPEQLRAHVQAGMAALEHVPPGPARAALRARLRIALGDGLGATGDFTGSLAALNTAVAAASPGSLEYACALAVRAQIYASANQLDKAAADAVEAYQLGSDEPWSEARIQAAYALAAVYGRAGLNAQADQLIGEVSDFAARNHRTHLSETAEFMRNRALMAERRYPEALESIHRLRSLAELLGDKLGVGAADLNECTALIELARFDEAAGPCSASEAALVQAQRPDLLNDFHVQQARLAVARHQPAEALRLLDAALANPWLPRESRIESRYLRYRAAAHAALGDSGAAYADIAKAYDIESRSTAREHVLAASVLGGMVERNRLLGAQRALQTRMDSQKLELAAERRLRVLSIAFSLGALLLAGLLGYYLRKSMRQRRELRRNAATLSTVVQHAPDGLVLLDERGIVQYSNRHLFDGGAEHPAGRDLLDEAPAPMVAPLRSTLETIYGSRRPATALAVSAGTVDRSRYYELQGAPVIENGQLLGAVVRSTDVTALRRLEREVVDASNRERLRLSNDLHEGLGQQLAGLSLLMRSALADVEKGGARARETLLAIGDHLTDSVEWVRQIARGLSPVAVERGSLGDALLRLVQDIGAPQGVAGAIDRDLEVSDEAADHLYRIASEALGAARHAKATRIVLSLERSDGDLRLTIADDGRAEPDAVGASSGPGAEPAAMSGVGLRLLEYRAHLLGATLTAEPSGSAGRRIEVQVPWERCRRALSETPAGTAR